MPRTVLRRTSTQIDRQSAGPKPFSREWLNTPPEQRALPQRPQVGPPPAWMPSMHGVSIALVVVLVLFATIFRPVSPRVSEPAGSRARTQQMVRPGISRRVTPTPAGDGVIALASPTPAASPAVVANVGADTEPILPTYRIVSYYGHPNDDTMGILGQFNKQDLLDQLKDEAAAYERADPSRPVMPASRSSTRWRSRSPARMASTFCIPTTPRCGITSSLHRRTTSC